MSSAALALLQAAGILVVAVMAQAYAAGHLPAAAVPEVLRPRIELSTRLRPWLLALAGALALAGLLVR